MDKFWQLVNKTESCWNFTGWLDRDGYGIFFTKPKYMRAHRYSAQLAGLDITGKVVCHKCDNRQCVNPDHLFVGTPADNVKDMIFKNRHFHNRSRKIGIRKITLEMREEILTSNLPKTELAKKFNVGRTTIYRVLSQGRI